MFEDLIFGPTAHSYLDTNMMKEGDHTTAAIIPGILDLVLELASSFGLLEYPTLPMNSATVSDRTTAEYLHN